MKRLALATSFLCALAPMTLATPLDYSFLPPAVEEQDLCGPADPFARNDTDIGPGSGNLTDKDRIRFLTRDIRQYQSEDPDRWFHFIDALIARRGALDESFDETDQTLARIALYVDSGRVQALQEAGLIEALLANPDALNNAQRMRLAQYLLTGTSITRDVDTAYALIREAGFAGNTDALLLLAQRMVAGDPVPDWDAPADLTVTMAFGGLLGPMDSGVCNRALRIAEEYRRGVIVRRDDGAALAWTRFAADLGSARAAWRMVENQLAAKGDTKDPEELMHYLQRAVDRGIAVSPTALSRIAAAGDMDVPELRRKLGYNFSESFGRRRPSLARHLELSVKPDAEVASNGSPYMTYLREISQIPGAPGDVFTELAKETLTRQGRWAGEEPALRDLEEATRRKDPEGTRLLAQRLIRYRQDPEQRNRAVDLLSYAGEQLGDAASLAALDRFYRCQIPDAPQISRARHWADAYRATGHASPGISGDDVITLDPLRDPWSFATLQTQALDGRPAALAGFLQLVQADPLARRSKQRLWADRADNSDKTLEEFAKLEFDLAGTPAERDLALEFFRRVYLNNGVTSALDLAIALVDRLARDPKAAEETRALLTQAAQRGEGAALRLLARLDQSANAETLLFEEYREVLEARGDFLGMMFALPHVSAEKQTDYIDRAISLMSCNTKDVIEMADIATRLSDRDESFRWQQVSLAIDGGNVLAKLRLRDGQTAVFDTEAAPGIAALVTRRAAETGTGMPAQALYKLFANSDLSSYATDRAATAFAQNLAAADRDALGWALEQYLIAPASLRAAIREAGDVNALIASAAEAGDPEAITLRAFTLMDSASNAESLQRAVAEVQRAAELGQMRAMAEWGRLLALGLGTQRNEQEAREWLEKATRAGYRDTTGLLRLLRLSDGG